MSQHNEWIPEIGKQVVLTESPTRWYNCFENLETETEIEDEKETSNITILIRLLVIFMIVWLCWYIMS